MEIEQRLGYYPDGSVMYERWGYKIREYAIGNFTMTPHRLDGPAMIDYNKKGEVCKWEWYISNIRIDKDIIRKYFADPINPTDEELLIFKLCEL